MEYRNIPGTNLQISAIGLGTWAMGNDFWGTVDDNTSVKAIETAIDHGINFIDTAPAYGDGHAEKVVGRAIKQHKDKTIIATKLGVKRAMGMFIRTLKPERVYSEIDASLKNLGIDSIDLYQIHWPDPNTPIADTLEALMKVKQQGKFKYLGVSNFTVEQLNQAREISEIVSLQPPFSMLHRESQDKLFPYCIENKIGIISYGTLVGGILTGKFKQIPNFKEGDNRQNFYNYFKEPVWGKIQQLINVLEKIAEKHNKSVGQVSINWTIQQKGITAALVGAKNHKQVTANIAGASFSLPANDLQEIDKAYKHLEIEPD